MTHYIETQIKDGSSIRIEVKDTTKPGTGFTRQPSPSDVSNEAVNNAYTQVLNTIRACADGVVDTIQNLESLPDAASIDFAVKVDAEAGAMIAKSREDAQFRISLSWKQAEAEEEQEEDS